MRYAISLSVQNYPLHELVLGEIWNQQIKKFEMTLPAKVRKIVAKTKLNLFIILILMPIGCTGEKKKKFHNFYTYSLKLSHFGGGRRWMWDRGTCRFLSVGTAGPRLISGDKLCTAANVCKFFIVTNYGRFCSIQFICMITLAWPPVLIRHGSTVPYKKWREESKNLCYQLL